MSCVSCSSGAGKCGGWAWNACHFFSWIKSSNWLHIHSGIQQWIAASGLRPLGEYLPCTLSEDDKASIFGHWRPTKLKISLPERAAIRYSKINLLKWGIPWCKRNPSSARSAPMWCWWRFSGPEGRFAFLRSWLRSSLLAYLLDIKGVPESESRTGGRLIFFAHFQWTN